MFLVVFTWIVAIDAPVSQTSFPGILRGVSFDPLTRLNEIRPVFLVLTRGILVEWYGDSGGGDSRSHDLLTNIIVRSSHVSEPWKSKADSPLRGLILLVLHEPRQPTSVSDQPTSRLVSNQ